MRLTPIDRPPTLLARLVFWGMRRWLGRVPTPYRVVFTRLPGALFGHLLLLRAYDGAGSLDPGLRLLIASHVASVNGCTFCVDIGRAIATKRALDLDKVTALADYRRDPRFDARERAALAYVEEATRERRVADTTFATLRRHFNAEEIVAITFHAAVENYLNMINIPLGIESDGFCALPAPASAAASA
jgi:AhpD family alkylhydroperoxidase